MDLMEPQTPIVISYSEIDTYRQCPLKHLIAYNQRWTKPAVAGGALFRGSLWHLVLEIHYTIIKRVQDELGGKAIRSLKDGRAALAEAETAVREHLYDPETGEQTEDQELIEWMYQGYVAHHGWDPDWLILGVEERFEFSLPDPLGGFSPFRLKAKLDLRVMVISTGKQWIIDHKSGANLPNQMDLDIDDQFGLYTWLGRAAGLRIMGTIHNAARTTRNMGDMPNPPAGKKPQSLEQRMHRTYLNRTDRELDNIAADAFNVAVHMYPEAVGYEALPLYSSPDPRQCGWKCDFKEPHMIARTGRNLTEVLTEYGFVQNFERH